MFGRTETSVAADTDAGGASAAPDRRAGIRPHGPYWRSLDGIRGVCMLVVLTYHVWPPWLPGASIGVDSFFVLSAFLITVLLLRERQRTGTIRFGRFYARRALRLLPPLVVVVAVAVPLAWHFLPAMRPDIWPSARSTLLYYANFRAAHHPTHMAVFLPTWSLSTEEQFYLVWPSALMLMLALRFGRRLQVATVAVALVAVVCWLQLAYERGTALSAIYYRPDLRVTGILIGTLLGLLYAYDLLPLDRIRPLLPTASLIAVVYLVGFVAHPQWVPARYQATMAIVVACLAWAVLVLQQVTAPLRPLQWLLDNPVAVWVGKTSYVVYLVHVPAIRLTRHALPAAGPAVVLLIAGAVTMALTVLLHYAVERPSLRLKDRRLEPVSDAAAPRVRAWRRGRRRPISTSSNAS